jgi:hypothetical protein
VSVVWYILEGKKNRESAGKETNAKMISYLVLYCRVLSLFNVLLFLVLSRLLVVACHVVSCIVLSSMSCLALSCFLSFLALSDQCLAFAWPCTVFNHFFALPCLPLSSA